jgi:hypothetical protein
MYDQVDYGHRKGSYDSEMSAGGGNKVEMCLLDNYHRRRYDRQDRGNSRPYNRQNESYSSRYRRK